MNKFVLAATVSVLSANSASAMTAIAFSCESPNGARVAIFNHYRTVVTSDAGLSNGIASAVHNPEGTEYSIAMFHGPNYTHLVVKGGNFELTGEGGIAPITGSCEAREEQVPYFD
jgi:hypothetical protein